MREAGQEEPTVRAAVCSQSQQSSPCDNNSGLKVGVHHISVSGCSGGGQHGSGTTQPREGVGAMEEGDGGKQEEEMEELGEVLD